MQKIVTGSQEYADALKKRGINDPSKVMTTPLTVGYFDGKDGLKTGRSPAESGELSGYRGR
ncbi:Primary amine oxidase precursor [Leclercia adecarboxylata]|uniref:Primary amine oxidase n=1 Tax=Leclercia adecarboxylata TaxID=83655 RepID=A0A4U9I1J2_9ENTR|nr:Primary amine oxidase precursor [Leclercia adecarboxylata]